MFDFSGREASLDSSKKFNEWLEECLDCDVLVVGAGVSALVAGLELQREDKKVLLVTEAAQPGGRLTWERGPVEILSPADELLGELGFPLNDNPPLWIDRLELLAYLSNRFYELGGLILNSVFIEGEPRREGENFELDILCDDRPFIINGPELISTVPGEKEIPGDAPCSEILEKIVQQTGRTEEGYVQAGLKAYYPGKKGQFCPLVNALLLSGRKAARFCLPGG
ncbi:MAG: FAD-binding protein [bacterium]